MRGRIHQWCKQNEGGALTADTDNGGPKFPLFSNLKASSEILKKPILALSMAVRKMDLWFSLLVIFQHAPQFVGSFRMS